MPRAILTYHSIDESGSVISTTAKMLRLHLASLVSQRVAVVSPSQAVADVATSSVALTFDDGFANFYTEAFPALAQNGLTATVFIVAGKCGQTADWARQPHALTSRGLLTWSRIKELQDAGIVFGAHSMTHASLPTLTPDEAESEILNSKREIEDRIGASVECFAYPYGEYTQRIADIVAEDFRVGLTTDMGFITNDSKPEALERIDAYYLRNAIWVDHLFAPLGRGYVACRASARLVKKRLTGRAGAR